MKKTILSSTILAAITALTFAPLASAHHPSEDMNPNFDFVDEQVSDMHIEIIDAMLEDGDLMSSTSRGSDAVTSPTMAEGVGANSSETATQSATQITTAPGNGASSAARGSAR
jgi:hypothetical protein